MQKTPKAPRLAALAAGVLLLGAGSGFASKITWHSNFQTGVGGEFTIVDTTGLDLGAYTSDTAGVVEGPNSFQTFCIEYNEHITKGQTVTFGLSDSAVMGGANTGGTVPGGNPDPISIGTAYLYSQFAAGTLTNYNYTPGASRRASAEELQNALWYLEGERSFAQIGGVNQYVDLVEGLFGAVSTDPTLGASRNANGTYNVFAVNLLDSSGNRRQDQLYVAPGAVIVPDGGVSVLLLGLALAGLAGGQALTRKSRN